MLGRRARLATVPLGLALALATPGAKPAEAQNLGERIGAALNRGAQPTRRARRTRDEAQPGALNGNRPPTAGGGHARTGL